MGSPVSATVANLVMEDVEQRALTSCTVQLPFWKQYVDDTVMALPQEQIQLFHDNLNSIEPTIQFTIETEVDRTLLLLDTRVTRHTDGSTFSGHFEHPLLLGRRSVDIPFNVYSRSKPSDP